MLGFVFRFLLCVLGLWLADELLAGIEIQGAATFALAALGLGAVNALVRPVIVVLTLPLTVVTLGFFLLVVNAGMLALVAALLPGFSIQGFGAAFLGSLVVGFVGWLGSSFIGPKGRFEVMVVRRELR